MVNIKKIPVILDEKAIITDRERMHGYRFDESGPAVRPEPTANVIILKLGNSKEISDILNLANQESNY